MARGERFAFDCLRARTSILCEDVPEAMEGLDLGGGEERFGGYSYTAAVYVLASRDLGPLREELHGFLAGLSGALVRGSFGLPVPAREVD